MFANVSPKQIKRIDWGWENEPGPLGPVVKKPLGEIRMPDLEGCFDWQTFEINMPPDTWPRMQHGVEIGTRNFKSIFTTAVRFMGLDRIRAEKPDLTPITEVYCDWNQRLLRAWRGKLKYFMIGDDQADDDGLLMPSEEWADYVAPHLLRLIDVGLDHGCTIIFRSGGDVTDITLTLENMGVSILNVEKSAGAKISMLMGPDRGEGRMRIWERIPEPGNLTEA